MSAPAPTARPRTGARPHRRTTRRRVLALPAALLVALPLMTAATTDAAAPPPGDDTWWDAPVPAGGPPLARTPVTVSLITGDRVRVEVGPDGLRAAPQPSSHRPVTLHRYERDGQLYVVPSDAAPLVPQVLDPELFNVTRLATYGYTGELPVIISAPAGRPLPQVEDAAGVSVTAALPSIDAVAATVDPTTWWRSRTGPSGGWSGVGRVWLDEPARPVLEHSVPMVGAPEAWQAGFDGTGITVAVLDSGIDADHPDLASKLVDAANFTTEPDAGDTYGHGTHVAGIVTGSGAASQGRYVGTAPGVRLVNAKVCLASGDCPQSAIIAGMEWAAERADVINMSLGTLFGSDGTDPMSQAVNALTAEHDVLFVVAAGNSGFLGAGSVGSPGAADAALTVGSVDTSGQLAPTSSRGPRLGDSAVKPDLTAPGVAIVSARAGGVPVPPGTEPVGEHYLRASGTSMATPHVAGAAAILLQQDPDLSAVDLKAALVGAAVPADGSSVYEQGGGLLDIPAALDARLRAGPAPLNLGLLAWPDDQEAPASRTVTYTNRTDRKLTVDLTLAVTGPAGLPHAPGALTVSPGRLQLPPRATRQATVTLDPQVATPGVSGGYLVATGSDGETLARTPLGFEIEPERLGLGGWEQAQKLTPSTGEAEGAFGRAIAVDGDTALIGAAGNADGDVSRGAAYVLTRDATGRWVEQARLVASDGAAWASFGASVALDGDTAVVGAVTATVDGDINRGAAYVFTRDGGTWTEQARLVAADGAAGDNFGTAVAVRGDTVLVGAANARPEGVFGQGAVYVYTRSGDTWTQDQVLVASDGGPGAAFGYAVTMAGDTALVGAPFTTVDGNFLQGAVYEFTHTGGTWSQDARVVASDGGPFEGFGASLATDGDTVVVGAPAAPVAGIPLGAAYVLTRDGDGWVEQARLTADDTGRDGGEFATAVAVEGGTVLAGTPWAMVGGNAVQGAVFVFTRSAEGWVRAARLTADDGASDDFLGGAVALSGGAAFAGAWLADIDEPGCMPGDPSCGEQGAVYVFTLSWALTADAYRDRGVWHAELSWSKPAGEVDVYRDGEHLATAGDGVTSYRDVLGRGRNFASATYVVCRAGTTDCSNEVTVVLDPRAGASPPNGPAIPV